MSFSEDPSSPAAPFSGDSTGQIFDLPDLIASSPTTTERVVDTQSGFLVVVKKLNDKLALSIKRRVGTPPSSSVPLTPDESVKLSKILGTSFGTEEFNLELAERKTRKRSASKLFGADDQVPGSIAPDDVAVPGQSLSSVHVPMKLMLSSVLRAFLIPILGIALSVFAIGIGAGVSGMKLFGKSELASTPVLVDPLEKGKVDTFVRDFVGKMLDFTAKTYKISQVQAMASMSPELLERYWHETKFPLSKRQLSGLPQGANILISELKQERLDANTVWVEVHAQLSDAANPNNATPVNLKLKLALDTNRQIFVVDQQDLSSAKK